VLTYAISGNVVGGFDEFGEFFGSLVKYPAMGADHPLLPECLILILINTLQSSSWSIT